MRVYDIKPVEVEITTIFTLNELYHLNKLLDSAIIRKDTLENETLSIYENFKELLEVLLKDSKNDAS
jgi:hypothetical protein